jgi:hypothetical protein
MLVSCSWEVDYFAQSHTRGELSVPTPTGADNGLGLKVRREPDVLATCGARNPLNHLPHRHAEVNDHGVELRLQDELPFHHLGQGFGYGIHQWLLGTVAA